MRHLDTIAMNIKAAAADFSSRGKFHSAEAVEAGAREIARMMKVADPMFDSILFLANCGLKEAVDAFATTRQTTSLMKPYKPTRKPNIR